MRERAALGRAPDAQVDFDPSSTYLSTWRGLARAIRHCCKSRRLADSVREWGSKSQVRRAGDTIRGESGHQGSFSTS
jgi:hypothetical protein